MEGGEPVNVNVGILGCGTVGTGVIELVQRRMGKFADATGLRPVIEKILIQDRAKSRSNFVDSKWLTCDASEVLQDRSISIIIEAMGGIEPARTYILEALRSGKHVITANKDLMAVCGEEIQHVAADSNVTLLYEAAVAGAIPVIRPLRECLMSNQISSVSGIVNGTCNYILTQMTETGAQFEPVLLEAQRLGYAESDPSSDIDGLDSARKLVILASLAFQTSVALGDVRVQGIRSIDRVDVMYATELSAVIKLMVEGVHGEDGMTLRVCPTLVPKRHPLAHVADVNNALYVHGDASGELMFYGQGAGSLPTASAVVGDLFAVLREMQFGSVRALWPTPTRLNVSGPTRSRTSSYYIRLRAQDVSGVFAKIATIFGERDVSMETVLQKRVEGCQADIVIVTHLTSEERIELVRHQLADLRPVLEICNVLPVMATSAAQ